RRASLPALFGVNDQSRRDRGQTFTAACEPEAVGGGRRYGNRGVQQLREQRLRLFAPRTDLRPIADHLDGRISDAVTLGCQQSTPMSEHVRTADAAPFLAVGAEHLADVAKPRSGQERITERMRGDIAVGMACTAVSIDKLQAQQPTRPTGLYWMYVG